MTIKQTEKIPQNVDVVFAIRQDVEKHPFFGMLSAKEKEYVRSIEKNLKEGERVVPLPGGRKMLFAKVPEKFNHRKSMLLMRKIVAIAKANRLKSIVVYIDDFRTGEKEFDAVMPRVAAMEFEMANFEFVKYKTQPKGGWNFVHEILIYAGKGRIVADIEKQLKEGTIIGEETNGTRELSNTPGGDMTPTVLAQAAIAAGKRSGFKVKVLQEGEIKKLKMGGVLGVARGSSEKPKFIIMEYVKGGKGKPIVLVGKGVTFDSGGLNLKPSSGIYEMHMDMSGGAAVIHTIAAAARLKLKKNIIGLVPAVENMPSGSSYRPGDLLKTMSGKTIEVLNTDAEGRVILSDALHYAKRYDPELVVDIATLTGAAMVALGQRASAIFATDGKTQERIVESGELSGDYVWPLPLWEEYEDDIKGTFGDVANDAKTRYGGAITAAAFLWQFAKGVSWVHIDMAPRMTSIDGDYLSKGATGSPVPLLLQFLRQ